MVLVAVGFWFEFLGLLSSFNSTCSGGEVGGRRKGG